MTGLTQSGRAPHRQVVLVTGALRAGKTTLARPLAAERGFALLAKDRIKETLADALGWSAVVLEANFWPDDDRHQRRIRALAAHVVEVYCACPLPIALRRYAERSASRHSVHSDAQRVVSAEAWARWARPAGIGELVTMDTSAPVDVAELAVGVRARLGASWRASCG